MSAPRILCVGLLAASAMCAVEMPVSQAIAGFEQQAGKAPKMIAVEYRLRAAQALKDRYPEQSRKLLDEALAELRGEDTVVPGASVIPRLAKELAPDQKISIERNTAKPEPPDPVIAKQIGTMRGLATDADRAKLVLEVVPKIRALPAGASKVRLARGLASLSTEGDLGKAALTAVATTLAGAMREMKDLGAYGDSYLEVASLARYERVEVPGTDAALDAANALLELRERVQQETGFTLTALDGKQYTLESLRGRVVLLNFWATWCPPCRREMPDMEKLYRRYEQQGLTVLAVSDEKRETVEGFLAKTPYSFPVLLDSGRTVHAAFGVEGIPKSFVFDREGRLAAQAIDMRTEAQFMDLLRRAGLQ